MTVGELINQLEFFDKESEVYIYDNENDRTYKILCIDFDEADEREVNANVLIFID